MIDSNRLKMELEALQRRQRHIDDQVRAMRDQSLMCQGAIQFTASLLAEAEKVEAETVKYDGAPVEDGGGAPEEGPVEDDDNPEIHP